MITKIPGFKHGYALEGQTTNEEFRKIVKEHTEEYGQFRCLICNSKTSKYFGLSLFGDNCITICNSIPDDHFFINRKN